MTEPAIIRFFGGERVKLFIRWPRAGLNYGLSGGYQIEYSPS